MIEAELSKTETASTNFYSMPTDEMVYQTLFFKDTVLVWFVFGSCLHKNLVEGFVEHHNSIFYDMDEKLLYTCMELIVVMYFIIDLLKRQLFMTEK